jgi:hypothetical protein
VFDTADADGDGRLEVRATGDVIGRVVNTFVRHAPEVIDAEITYADGTTDVLTGTPNHPFWVDAVRDYVPLGELAVGTQLHVQGGGAAILVSKTWRQGDFEVFDFEVEGLHNFYVRGPDGDAPGVLVHNSSASKGVDTSWFPDRALPRDANGVPIPDSQYPHTQLGTKQGSKGAYGQAREFGEGGKPVKDIDFTDHGRSDHPDPHQHRFLENETGGTPKRGPTEPLETPE